jgi:O-antigen/teichoic acid export membrane protein
MESKLIVSPVFLALLTSILTRGTQSLGGVIINAAIARHLKPEEFGIYFIVLAVASLLATFILMGANTVILRISASKGAAVAFRVMSKMTITMVLTACLVYVIYLSGFGSSLMIFVGLSVSPNLKYTVAALAASVAMQSLIHDYYRGCGKLTTASAVANYGALGSIGYGFISNILFCFGLSWLLFVGVKLTLLQIIWSGTFIGAAVVGCAWFIEKLRFNRLPAQSIIEDTLDKRRKGERVGLLVTALLAIVLNQMDIYTVSIHFSKIDVGLYAAAQRLSLLVLLPLMIITAFFQPISAHLFSIGDTKTLSGVARAFTSVLLMMGTVALIIFMAAGKPIMGFVYGPAFVAGTTILVLKSAGFVALLGTGLANAVFTTTGNERVLVIVGSLGVCLFLLVTLIWPPGSIEVVAALHAGVMALMSFLYVFFSRKHLSIDISPCLRPRTVWKILQSTFSRRGGVKISVEKS